MQSNLLSGRINIDRFAGHILKVLGEVTYRDQPAKSLSLVIVVDPHGNWWGRFTHRVAQIAYSPKSESELLGICISTCTCLTSWLAGLLRHKVEMWSVLPQE